ncbi:hypothetical protein J4456_04000 [Candidatus Pacearchaeota archaeon]|nr:hypothetical protein [Candidatus Pacearchaeota archaeon]
MAEKDKVFKTKIKHTGIFNFKDFYEFLYDYFLNENYDIFEDKYIEKLKGESKDVEVKWTATKEVTDYFKYEVTLSWLILGMKKVKVKKDGKEIYMDTATMDMRFDANLVKDYEHRWENHPFWKFLRGMYDRYIIKTRTEEIEMKIFQEVNEIVAQAKSFLAIEGQRS